MSAPRIALIANPQAGNCRARELAHRASRELWGYDIDVHFPNSAEALAATCASLSRDTHSAAVVIGGDGTQNLALRGLWKDAAGGFSGVPIYPFPGGTANDLACELGLRPSLSQMQRLLDEGRHSAIDVITCNGRPFTTVAGMGLGGALTQLVNQTRVESRVFRTLMKHLKSETYTGLSAMLLLGPQSYLQRVQILSDAFNDRMRIAALFVCNQDRLGGDLKVGNDCRNDDGIFSVLIVPAQGPAGLLQAMLDLKRGRTPSGAIRFSTRHLVLKSLERKPLTIFGDGEVLLEDSRVEFRIHPGSLRVYHGGAG